MAKLVVEEEESGLIKEEEEEKKEIEKAIEAVKSPKIELIRKIKDMAIDVNLNKIFKKKEKLPIEEIPDLEIEIPFKKSVVPKEVSKPGKKFSEVDFIKQRIYEAKEALADLDFEHTRRIYVEIMASYKGLSDKDKAKVYEDISQLYYDRKNAEAMFAKK